MTQLANKTALVSGAASGIGLAIAHAFVQAGAEVYIADINEEAGRKATQDLQDKGYKANFIHVNVAVEKDCQDAMKHVLRASDKLDVLVNNAGVGGVGTILETTTEDLDRMYNVNVKGTFNLSKAFLPSMLEKGRGSIINVASIAGVLGLVDRLAYVASKFAIVGITKAMALDHAKQGIRVNAICPGRVETAWVKRVIQEYDDPEKAYKEMSATQPMGRMALPEEVASVAVFLASEASSFVTGSCQLVDGGWGAG